MPRGSGDQPQKGARTAVSSVNQATSGTRGQPEDNVMKNTRPGKAAETTAAVKDLSVSRAPKKEGGQPKHDEKLLKNSLRLSDDEGLPTKKAATTCTVTVLEKRSPSAPKATTRTLSSWKRRAALLNRLREGGRPRPNMQRKTSLLA